MDLQSKRNLHLRWLFDTPREVQSFAINQYKNAYQIQKKIHDKKFTMWYRSKKESIQSIMVLARDYNRKREKLPEINNAMIIMLDKYGRFYIHISVLLKDRESQTSCNGQIVSIDPGVRTFTTCYDPIVEWDKRW
ncbi:28142_t:CDS:2 [Gigaspora margarita]|uniref:28142_t:CDS:1 n=1 Tax=Gigaspora margarita TaxID=4874 RepID=A0ABN7UJK2_GIGMA|nr:28142_t:CDS:2 [Gigaspora margarita]